MYWVGPLADRGVEFVSSPPTSGVALQIRVGGQVRPADGLHVTLEDRVAVAGDDDAGAVGARVGVARRDALHPAADALAGHAVGEIVGYQRLHHRQHGLVEGDVDDTLCQRDFHPATLEQRHH